MKKIHIALVGIALIMASPAIASEPQQSRYQNDNARPAASTNNQPPAINYADYTENDDDHGDEQEIFPAGTNSPAPSQNNSQNRR